MAQLVGWNDAAEVGMTRDSHFRQLGSAWTVQEMRTDDEAQSPGLATGDSHLRWVG